MTSLSPKAIRFIDLAVKELGDRQISTIWHADRDVAGELPDAAARGALTALAEFERRLCAQLDRTTDEDEASDISNDLGLVRAIEGDLAKQLASRAT